MTISESSDSLFSGPVATDTMTGRIVASLNRHTEGLVMASCLWKSGRMELGKWNELSWVERLGVRTVAVVDDSRMLAIVTWMNYVMACPKFRYWWYVKMICQLNPGRISMHECQRLSYLLSSKFDYINRAFPEVPQHSTSDLLSLQLDQSPRVCEHKSQPSVVHCPVGQAWASFTDLAVHQARISHLSLCRCFCP